MAVTLTPDVGFGTKYTLDSMQANGLGIMFGTIDMASTYAAGGLTCTFPFHNLNLAIIENRLVTATNVFFSYDATNTKIMAFEMLATTTAAGHPHSELASDTDISNFSAVNFVAIGRD